MGQMLDEGAVAEAGVRLIITVDNGSSARGPIELARELGIDVIVVDHHQPSVDLPEPYAHVNPLLDESGRARLELARGDRGSGMHGCFKPTRRE